MDKKKVDWTKYDKKYKTVLLKLKPDVYDIIYKKAKDYQRKEVPSLATYFIAVGLSKHVPQQKSVPEVNRETLTELKRIGNNINQLTKVVHQKVLDGENISFLFLLDDLNMMNLRFESLARTIVPYDN